MLLTCNPSTEVQGRTTSPTTTIRRVQLPPEEAVGFLQNTHSPPTKFHLSCLLKLRMLFWLERQPRGYPQPFGACTLRKECHKVSNTSKDMAATLNVGTMQHCSLADHSPGWGTHHLHVPLFRVPRHHLSTQNWSQTQVQLVRATQCHYCWAQLPAGSLLASKWLLLDTSLLWALLRVQAERAKEPHSPVL